MTSTGAKGGSPQSIVSLLPELPPGPLGERKTGTARRRLETGALLVADGNLETLGHTHEDEYVAYSTTCQDEPAWRTSRGTSSGATHTRGHENQRALDSSTAFAIIE
jgi:hypothetical protein